jgi:hypothetical protein
MSLINDALKRAKQAQKENPAPPPALPFKAADPFQQRNSGPPILLIVAVVVVLALVGWFVVMALQKRETVHPVANAKQPDESIMQTAAPSVVTPAANSVPAQQPAPPAVPVQPVSTTNSAVAAGNPATAPRPAPTDSVTNVTVAAPDAAPPKPALPKLQGIFYRPARPSAVINGKNVSIGSRVGDFQVLAIRQESVIIGSATQTNILSLE